MDRSIPWDRFESIIEPFYPKAGNSRRPYALSTMLRIHCLQQWYCLSDPTMEEELSEIASMRQFAERPGRIRAMKKRTGIDKINRAIERSKASIRAKVAW